MRRCVSVELRLTSGLAVPAMPGEGRSGRLPCAWLSPTAPDSMA